MTSININLGDAFLLETPPKGQHLYIAIAKTSDINYLFVNLTTRREKSETTCIIQPNISGELSFISRESVIAYSYAREMNANELSRLICEGSRIPKCCFPADICWKYNKGEWLQNDYRKSTRRHSSDF